MKRLIYVADDDARICRMIKELLREEGYKVICFETGDLLFSAYQHEACDLAILDVVMPGNDGFVIGMKIKRLSATPVIIVTGVRTSDDDYSFGLSLGFDAYFVKPCNRIKLIAHVRSLLIKAELTKVTMVAPPVEEVSVISYEDILVYPDMMAVVCNSVEMQLTNIEFNMLSFIVENKSRAISRGELLNKIWGRDSFVGPRATDDIIKRLRRKILDAGSRVSIDTVYGFGFRLSVKA